MEADLIAALLADAGLTAVFSTRINWLQRPELEALPAMTLQLVSRRLTIVTQGDVCVDESVVQFDLYAERMPQIVAGQQALRAMLSARSFTQGATQFRGGFLRGQRHAVHPVDGLTETIRHASIDYTLWTKGA